MQEFGDSNKVGGVVGGNVDYFEDEVNEVAPVV